AASRFFCQAEDGIRYWSVTGVQTCALPISVASAKELITVTGATALFSPLIAGVVEQAKVLYLQQNPGLSKDLNEIATQMRADLRSEERRVGKECKSRWGRKH